MYTSSSTDGLSQGPSDQRRQARAPGPHRGLPPGASATDRAPDAAKASPEPASGAGVGALAGVSTSVPEGAHAAQPRAGLSSVDGWSRLPPRFRSIQEARDATALFIWVQADSLLRGTNAPHIPYLTPPHIQLPLGDQPYGQAEIPLMANDNSDLVWYA